MTIRLGEVPVVFVLENYLGCDTVEESDRLFIDPKLIRVGQLSGVLIKDDRVEHTGTAL